MDRLGPGLAHRRAVPAHADDIELAKSEPAYYKRMSLEELMNVEVTTVSRRPSTIVESPAAVYVITQEDIRRSGARKFPKRCAWRPGCDVAQIDSEHVGHSARGFNDRLTANKLLVLIDGRSVYSPLFAGVFWDVQDMLLEDIERIEVIRGPGGDAVGRQRGQRRDQHHHQKIKGYPGGAAYVRRRHHGTRLWRSEIWLGARRECDRPRLREAF